ncbi:Transcriptional regulatory protein CusR [Phycisphaerales bacterium]|nr:Transcriptional regulatory protein CusR [Phycisphaerales bacterium]
MRMLIIEDCEELAQSVAHGLRSQGYCVDRTTGGRDGEAMSADSSYDAIILDLMLPDCDGLEVCRNLRRRRVATPILILSALSRTEDKVEALNAGADDYLCKPADPDELLARVRALMRRHEGVDGAVLRFGDLEMDLLKRRVTVSGTAVRMSCREMALLELLLRNQERVLSRTLIGERVWDLNYEPSSNVIDVCVSAVRRKLAAVSEMPYIHTVIGAGYRLGAPEPARVERARPVELGACG